MCRSGFMRAFSTGMRPSLVNSAACGVVVEGAGDQHVEAGIARLAGGGDQVGALTVPNSGPMKMAARFCWLFALVVRPSAQTTLAGPGLERW